MALAGPCRQCARLFDGARWLDQMPPAAAAGFPCYRSHMKQRRLASPFGPTIAVNARLAARGYPLARADAGKPQTPLTSMALAG